VSREAGAFKSGKIGPRHKNTPRASPPHALIDFALGTHDTQEAFVNDQSDTIFQSFQHRY
jgi:hypothetical protein